jgi:hypothetical protein
VIVAVADIAAAVTGSPSIAGTLGDPEKGISAVSRSAATLQIAVASALR